MTMYRRLFLIAIAALATLPALSADKPDPAKRLQQQLRKAEQERQQLTLQKVEAEKQLKDAQEKAAEAGRSATQRNARLSREVASLKAEKEALAESSKVEQAALTAKLTETERRLSELRLEKQQLDAVFARQKTALGTCVERNVGMYRLGNEVLDKYEQKGCFTSLLQGEPFTQLQRAKIENFMEDYRDKLEAQKFEPAAGRPVAGK